jgi:NAD(P)-dependent dehydrogenase (short-subunit alcohol dehydrogenase family)
MWMTSATEVTLVTGAGSGLGAATARAFAAEGSAVALLDRNENAARSVCEDLAAGGHDVLALQVDVSDADSVDRAVQAVVKRWGRVDNAISCAGVDYVTPVSDMSVEQWDRVIGVNLRGPFLIARAVLPQMQQQRRGDIVNVASTAAVRAWGNAGAYHASKWGLVGFSRGLGVECREFGVRVTTIIPGGMKTHWFDSFPEQGIPLPDERHLQDPATVARTIVFATRVPRESAVQELMVTPLTETSWP